MTDIFNEIDEDLRRERLGKLWKRFGPLIIALAVLIVVGVAGWRGYEWWQIRAAQADGARFAAALQLAEEGKHAEAQAAFAEIGRDGTGGYRILARFRAAAELAMTDRAAAVAAYDALANENGVDPLARDVARIRAGLLLVDTAPLADIQTRMQPLDTPTGAFRLSAREIVGLAQYRAGEYEAAAKSFESILADPELPPGMRQRAELMRSLAAAGPPAPAGVAPPETLGMPAPVAPELPALPGAAGVPDASPVPSQPVAPGAPAVPDVAVPAPAAEEPGPAIPALPEPAASAPAAPEAPAPEASAPEAPATEAPATEPPAAADAPPAGAPAADAPAAETPAAEPAPAPEAAPPAPAPAAPQ